MSLITTNRTTQEVAALGVRARDRAKDAAAQAIPVGKRAGTTAVQGVRQGVQGARVWAAPRVEDAVYGARVWAAPRIEDAADAVDTTVAPAVSSYLRSTARQVRPDVTRKTGVRRLLSSPWLLGAAVAMRRRYASATAEAKDATESPEEDRASQDGEQPGDAALRSDVNGRVNTPGM